MKPAEEHAPEKGSRAAVALGLVAVVLAAFALRAWGLFHRGVLDYDESYYYILGRNLLAGNGYTLNGLPHTAFPPLYPLLVGVVGLFTSSIAATTSTVSAIAGAFLPLPVYFFAKDLHGRLAGFFAAAGAAAWPALTFFSAKYVSYGRRLYFGSEPLYITLLASAMLFTWLFARHRGYRNALLAGSFFGLASLVRNEGPVVFSFLFIWLILSLPFVRAVLRTRALFQTALAAVAMLVTFSPFLIYIHAVTGQWSLGAKLENNIRIRDTLWKWVRLHDTFDFVKTHYRLNYDNTQFEDPYWGVSPWHVEMVKRSSGAHKALRLLAHPDWRWLPWFVEIFVKGVPPLVAWYAWIFIVLSIASPPWNRLRLGWWSFFAMNVAPMLMLAVTLYVLPRLELPLLVLFAVEFGRGAAVVAGWWRRLAAKALSPGRLAAAAGLAPAVLAVAAMAWGGVAANALGNRPNSRDPALSLQVYDVGFAAWLKEHTPPGSTLMCNDPWLALWSGAEWRACPVADPARMLEYVRAKRIDFAVIYPWETRENKPPGTVPPALEPYVFARLDFGGPVTVYDFRPVWK